ncbi:MAG: leucine-rich repeat domain-containing protein [Lachnospira sp.]
MKNDRIKVTLFNKTFKEIDLSDFTFIGEELFSNRDDIVSITLPTGVKVIGANAFEYCSRLEEVVFPDTLESIEKEAFLNCTSLKKADLPQNVNVDPTAFKGCIEL